VLLRQVTQHKVDLAALGGRVSKAVNHVLSRVAVGAEQETSKHAFVLQYHHMDERIQGQPPRPKQVA
jgi:hypothetical protein